MKCDWPKCEERGMYEWSEKWICPTHYDIIKLNKNFLYFV